MLFYEIELDKYDQPVGFIMLVGSTIRKTMDEIGEDEIEGIGVAMPESFDYV